MYRFSRAIYRELAQEIMDDPYHRGNHTCHERNYKNHEFVLRACEGAVERLATDRHYFAHPARTLFKDVRDYFPLHAQARVLRVIERYLDYADEFLQNQPNNGFDVYGNPLRCRASTRKGTPCQRMPLPHNGYCPSHQHLAETEELEPALAGQHSLTQPALAA